jgi:hypothetical protein
MLSTAGEETSQPGATDGEACNHSSANELALEADIHIWTSGTGKRQGGSLSFFRCMFFFMLRLFYNYFLSCVLSPMNGSSFHNLLHVLGEAKQEQEQVKLDIIIVTVLLGRTVHS